MAPRAFLGTIRRRGSRAAGFDARCELARPDALKIGVRTYAASSTLVKTWAPSESIEIGSWCSIAGEVRILHPGISETLIDPEGTEVTLRLRGNHRMDTATTYPIGIALPETRFDEVPADGRLRSRPLIIGSDVWIGYGAMVLGAVTIGHGAIVGAGAVVASDVPSYAVVVGNPSRILKMRFPPEIVESLLAIAWWDWPEAQVLAHGDWFMRPVSEFVTQFDRRSGAS